MTECTDGNDENHDCDYTGCNKPNVDSGCYDDNKDHNCDECKTAINSCADFEHSYADNGDGTHDERCDYCTTLVVDNADHHYNANGVCACGNTAEAKVGETYYCFFTDAVAAAKNNQTIILCKDASGAGVVINKSITIDFKGFAYTLTEGVGSTGTASNGFQILQGNTVVLKNGTLNVAEEAKESFYILIQNYANLTVTDMTLDGTNLDKWSLTDGDSYVLSNNSGTVNINGNTNILANDQGDKAFAFDVCKYGSYAAPTVYVNTTGLITGKIEVTESISDNLKISGGSFTVDVTEYCVEGFHTVDADKDGIYTYGNHSYTSVVTAPTCTERGYTTHTCACGDSYVDSYVNESGHAYDDDFDATCNNNCGHVRDDAKVLIAMIGEQKFDSLAAAVAAAQDGDTIVLCRTTSGAGVVIDKSITIDFGGYTYSFTGGVGSTGTASNGFQILQGNTVVLKNGTLNVAEEAKESFYILIQNYANLTVTDMTLDGTNLDKWSLTDGDSYVLSNNSGTVNINGNTNILANDQGDKAFAFDVCKYGSYAAPTVYVNTTGLITGKIEVTESISDNLKISGGSFTVDVTEYCVEGFHTVDADDDGIYEYGEHSYKVEFRWNLVTKEGTAYWTCECCGESFDIDTVTTSEYVAGDCQNKAQTIYTATAVFEGETYTSTYVSVGNYGDHEAGKVEFRWNLVTKEGTAYWTCECCGESFDIDTVTTSEHVAGDCQNKEQTIYTATAVFEGETYTSTYVSVGDYGKHEAGKVEFRWNLVTNVGTAYWTCECCGERFDIETETTSEYVEGDCKNREQTIYTATAVFEGETYTSTYVSVGNYGEHVDENADHWCDTCGKSLLKGDLDLDGDVDAEDLTLLARHTAGIELLTDTAALRNADVNNDGLINSDDLTLHARYVAGIITTWKDEE